MSYDRGGIRVWVGGLDDRIQQSELEAEARAQRAVRAGGAPWPRPDRSASPWDPAEATRGGAATP